MTTDARQLSEESLQLLRRQAHRLRHEMNVNGGDQTSTVTGYQASALHAPDVQQAASRAMAATSRGRTPRSRPAASPGTVTRPAPSASIRQATIRFSLVSAREIH